MNKVTTQAIEIKTDKATQKVLSKRALSKKEDKTILYGNRFCFIRSTDEGRILKIFHPLKEKTDIVNFKKTLASTFQINLKKTNSEKETDSESTHISHYTYEKKGKNKIEHRTINTDDVLKYSGSTGNDDDTDYLSKEDIELDKNNVIQESSGESITSLTKKEAEEESDENEDIPPIETKCLYKLKLVKCKLTTADIMNSDKSTSVSDYATKWEAEPLMDGLMAKFDERESEISDMQELLKEPLPDLEETARRMTRSVDMPSNQGTSNLHKWRQLLELESKYGPLPGRKPIVNSLANDLKKIQNDNSDHSFQQRMIIYDLLSSEGSLVAQKALMNALKMKQIIDEEYDNIIMAITLLGSIDQSTLLDYKEYMLANNTNDEHVLLSLATLGRHKNIEQTVVDMIIQLIEKQEANDTESLIYFIHALGNTGSELIVPILTPLLLDNSYNEEIHLVIIDALRTVSIDNRVQMIFSELINDTMSASTVSAIIESLRFPYEYSLYYPVGPSKKQKVDKVLLANIVNATILLNDDQLYNATINYLKAIKTEYTKQLLNDYFLRNNSTKRSKRETSTNWSSRNYDEIASSGSRATDQRQYPHNKAFLFKKRLGPSKLHAEVVGGGFAGINMNGGQHKLLGKAVVKIHVYGRTYTALEGEYLNLRNQNSISSRSYVKVFGIARLPYYESRSLPYHRKWSKVFHSFQVFKHHKRKFVKIGFLNLELKGVLKLIGSLTVNVLKSGYMGEVAFEPTFVVTGDARLSQGIHRVGLRVKATISYSIGPRASITMCDANPNADVSVCYGLFCGSKGINVDIYAYYEHRTAKISWRGIQFTWRTYKLNLFSSTYNHPQLSERLLWGECHACSCKNYCLPRCPGYCSAGYDCINAAYS